QLLTPIFGVSEANGFSYMISFIIYQTSFMMTFTYINTNIKHEEHHQIHYLSDGRGPLVFIDIQPRSIYDNGCVIQLIRIVLERKRCQSYERRLSFKEGADNLYLIKYIIPEKRYNDLRN